MFAVVVKSPRGGNQFCVHNLAQYASLYRCAVGLDLVSHTAGYNPLLPRPGIAAALSSFLFFAFFNVCVCVFHTFSLCTLILLTKKSLTQGERTTPSGSFRHVRRDWNSQSCALEAGTAARC